MGSETGAKAPFSRNEDKRSCFLEIKPSNSNKDLTGAERCNSFFPVPVGLSQFSLPFVRSVRNVWIRSFGAVPRTWFMWYQRILMFCQGPFCHWEFRGWVCKELAELQYKENSWATYSGRQIFSQRPPGSCTSRLHPKGQGAKERQVTVLTSATLHSWSWNIGCPDHGFTLKYKLLE